VECGLRSAESAINPQSTIVRNPQSAIIKKSAIRNPRSAMTLAYAAAAAAFVAYAVWGTLFPFDFQAVPFETAARLFWSRWATDAGSLSLTDLVSNVLLFLPIGLFMSAALESPAKRGPIPFPQLVTLLAAVALSGTLELAQAFVSWRTSSILDVAAEVLGAVSGIAIWRYLRGELDALLRAGLRMVGRSTRFERILLACCAAFVIGWWLPADFTLRPAEIGDKYLHERLLLPFTPSEDAATPYELVTIAAAAIPIGLAAVLCGSGSRRRRSVASGALIAALGLAALELIQIPIFSRTTDGTELLAALGGSTAGSAAAALSERATVIGVDWRLVRIAGAFVAAVGVALLIEWWPFQLTMDSGRAFLEATRWSRAPFRWPASIADVLPGAVLAAVAGMLVRPRLDPRFVRLQTMLVVGCAGAVFAVCEGGRVLLVSGRPTLMSVVFKLSALAFGLYIGSRRCPIAFIAARPDNP
jgi:hypothetical protein